MLARLAVQVDEVCEKCANPQMSVKTMQLRSADEGGEDRRFGMRVTSERPELIALHIATVFYSCEKCGHQARLNN